MGNATHRFVGDHPDVLADGRPVAPGEFVELTDEDMQDPHNADKIEQGLFLTLDDGDHPLASPEAEQLAEEHNIPLTDVAGSGSGGRILVSDVERRITELEEE